MTATRLSLPQILAKGILGGALVGFLISAYVVEVSREYVFQQEDFAHALAFEQTEQRYASTVVLALVLVFAGIGPFVAAATFGPWLRHAVYGFVGSFFVVVGMVVVAAALTNQQPFNMHKGSGSTWINIGRLYGVPAALLVGPVVGLLIGKSRRCGTARPSETQPSSHGI